MTRDEAVQKAEECFAEADRLLHTTLMTVAEPLAWNDLGRSYLALARLADD